MQEDCIKKPLADSFKIYHNVNRSINIGTWQKNAAYQCLYHNRHKSM